VLYEFEGFTNDLGGIEGTKDSDFCLVKAYKVLVIVGLLNKGIL